MIKTLSFNRAEAEHLFNLLDKEIKFFKEKGWDNAIRFNEQLKKKIHLMEAARRDI